MKYILAILAILTLGAVALSTVKQAQNTNGSAEGVEQPISDPAVESEQPKVENPGDMASEGEKMEQVPYLSEERVIKFAKAEQVIDANKFDYSAEIETTKGIIKADLLESDAPKSVNSFVFLALNHYYEGIYFHRVIPGFMAQTGDPTGTGMGDPGYKFGLEVKPSLRFNKAGVFGMARSQNPDSNGSQFFITYDASSDFLSGQYSVWGQVTDGMDVVNAISKTEGVANPVSGDKRDQILSVKIFRTAK